MESGCSFSATKMKMAVVSELSVLLLLLLLLPSTESGGDCNTFAATGETIMLPLGHQLKDTDRLKWKRGSDLFVDRKPPGPNYTFVKGDRSNVYPNGSLKLVNLNKVDAMKYTPVVFGEDGVSVPNLKSIQLCVFDRVKQPTLKIDCLKTHVNLTCKVAQVKDLNFEWLKNNKVMMKMNSQIWKLERKYVIDGTDSFSCKVSNPLGGMTSPPVVVNCNKSFFSNSLEELIWICVGGGGGLVLMLTIIIIICCVRARRKKRNQKTDEEELRLRWTNSEQQQQQRQCPHRGHPPSHHQHQHQHQQQPAGHTGPRQHRSKQPRPRPRDPPTADTQPSPKRPAQSVRADVNGDEDLPPPLPQPRTKTPRAKRV